MIRLTARLCSCLVICTILLACSGHVQPKGRIAEKSREDFMYALRWKQYGMAAAMMQQAEDREHFMNTFTALKELHVTDVRILKLKTFEAGSRFNVTFEMDYYLPPSVTLETFTFEQTWVYFGDEDSTDRGFLIVTPFPDFP